MQRRAVLGRKILGIDNVFYAHRDAVQRPCRVALSALFISPPGLIESVLGVQMRSGFDPGVDFLDPVEAGLDQFFGTDRAFAQSPNGLGCGKGEKGHVAGDAGDDRNRGVEATLSIDRFLRRQMSRKSQITSDQPGGRMMTSIGVAKPPRVDPGASMISTVMGTKEVGIPGKNAPWRSFPFARPGHWTFAGCRAGRRTLLYCMKRRTCRELYQHSLFMPTRMRGAVG